MENKINWWLIIGIVVVVAVITALVTMQVTGNVINMANPDVSACYNSCISQKCVNVTKTALTQCRNTCFSSCSKVEVYTKAEVDALLAKVSGGSSGNEDFSTAILIADDYNPELYKVGNTCTDFCNNANKKCLIGEVFGHPTFANGSAISNKEMALVVPCKTDLRNGDNITRGLAVYDTGCICY